MNPPPFLNRPDEKSGRTGASLVLKLWLRAGVAAAAAVAFGCLYFFVRQYFKDGVWRFDLILVNKSLGTAALFLVALSMFLTGVAYFSRHSGRSLSYRKHYGLMGFWTGLVHGAVNLFLLPAVGLHPERKLDAWVSDAPGLLALVLFGAMALLSNAGVKGRLGGETWRKALRYGGYAALLLAVAHTALLKWTSWTKYVRTFDSFLPSLSLPVAAFAAAAVVLRLAAWIFEARKK
ncbi:MAG: ferric reductase-like transmembrane domain-containing protein [Acidobacteria bacterium]|nr:ferric reductase-like transmembrane domain-containing protein [Acidobacteriota bacterium]MBE3129511.1 ferric reductase-like transmembrane domain-containing protein [Acidobacteriota bacterium]